MARRMSGAKISWMLPQSHFETVGDEDSSGSIRQPRAWKSCCARPRAEGVALLGAIALNVSRRLKLVGAGVQCATQTAAAAR